MCGLMLTLAVLILLSCIGLTDNLRVSSHTINCFYNFNLLVLLHSHLHVIQFSHMFLLFSIKIRSGFILVLTGQCLLCAALEQSNALNYWSTSIGRRKIGSFYHVSVDSTRWTTALSYVCQYHSKLLYGLSLSIYISVSRLSDWRYGNFPPSNCSFRLRSADSPLNR